MWCSGRRFFDFGGLNLWPSVNNFSAIELVFAAYLDYAVHSHPSGLMKAINITYSLLVVCASLTSVSGQVVFNFTYDDVNTGFKDPTFGTTRQSTVTAVGSYLSSVFTSLSAVTVDFNWEASQSGGTGSLASAGTSYLTNQKISNGFLFKHITTGIDPSGGSSDGSGTVNFGFNWNSDTGTPEAGEFDLFTVVLHELGHALGFASLINENTTSGIPGTYSGFDNFLSGPSVGDLVSGAGAFTGQATDLTSGSVKFLGTGAASNVSIFSPDPFESGSSLSHTDNIEGFVMNPSISAGAMIRQFNSTELAIFNDLGFTVVPGTL